MWPVDESVYAHIFDGFWLSEEVKHCLMATSNHRCEGVDHFDESVASFDDALVVERYVVVGFLVADLGQARLKVFEVTPHVAVVGAEAGKVNVGEKKHTVHPETTVAASVSR